MGKYLLKYDDEYSYQKKEQDLTYSVVVYGMEASASTEDGIDYTLNVKTQETTGITPFEFSINVKGNFSGAAGYIGLTLDISGNLVEAKEITEIAGGVEKTVSGEEETMYLWEYRYLDGTQFGWTNGDQVYTGNTEPLSLDENKHILHYRIYGIGDNYLPKTVNSVKPGVSYTIENKNVCYNPIIRYLTATYLIESANTQISLYNPYGKYGAYEGPSRAPSPALFGANDFIEPNTDKEQAVTWRVVYMEIDGKQEDVHHLHTFETTGEHVVRFGIAMNDRVVPSGFFATYRPGQGGGIVKSSSPNILGDVSPLNDSTLGETIDTSSLVKVDIPEGFNGIGSYCFYGTNLYSGVTMPSTMKKIQDGAFSETKISVDFNIPTNILKVGDYLFKDAYLNNIPDFGNITEIPTGCFAGVHFAEEPIIPSGIKILGYSAFTKAFYPTSSITIPSNVIEIKDHCFDAYYAGVLTSITFSEGLKKIGNYVFSRQEIVDYVFPYSLEEIGSQCFEASYVIKTVTFNGLKKLGKYCFSHNSSLTDVMLPEGLIEVGERAFDYSTENLTGITVPSTLETVGKNGFTSTQISGTLNLPNIKHIGTGAFASTKITNVILPSNITRIPAGCFSSTPLTGITAPGVVDIAIAAFNRCSALTSIQLNQNLSALGDIAEGENYQYYEGPYYTSYNGVFEKCTSLTGITLPAGITEIPIACFSGCTSLRSVTAEGTITKVGRWAFDGTPYLTSSTLNYGGIKYLFDNCAYKAVSSASTSYTLKDTTVSISERCFYGCSNFTAITIPNTVTEIGARAFESCKKLKSVTIPDSVKMVGDNTFMYSSGLTTAVLGTGLTFIPENMFNGCTSLNSVTIPNGITTMGDFAFCSCASLYSITIPNTVTEIGEGCFFMAGLRSVTIPDSVTKLGERPFVCHNMQTFSGKYASQDGKYLSKDNVMIAYAMSGLTNFVAPEEIKRIGPYCFNFCPSLTGLTFHSGVTDVDLYCFCGATNVVSITLLSSSNTIAKTEGGYDRFKGSDTGTIYVPAGCSSNFGLWIASDWTGETWYKGKTSWVIEELP